jgi:hypothetical protein
LDRSEALKRLLEQTGFAAAERSPLAGDASTRSYERLRIGDRRAVLMDAPLREDPPCPASATPDQRRAMGWNAVARLAASRVEAFAAVAAHLKSLGLAAPDVYGMDASAGYAVLEDLGDDLFANVIGRSAEEIPLYEAAALLLAHVHAAPIPAKLEAPDGASWPILDYDALALEVNANLFVDWLPKAEDVRIDDAAIARWADRQGAGLSARLHDPRLPRRKSVVAAQPPRAAARGLARFPGCGARLAGLGFFHAAA